MKKIFRKLSLLLLISALAGLGALLICDAVNHLSLTFIHQRTGALCFMLVGASYISLLLSLGRPWREKFKEMLLGVGFLLWGCEQFLPSGPLVTVMDSMVVLIFVTDLSLVIVNHLRHKGEKSFSSQTP
jgi:peptidoglycan/LPS O-acetylase OafA/YrhL